MTELEEFNAKLAREAEEWHQTTGGRADKATWLDRCAWAAMQGCLAYSNVNPSHGNYHENATAEDVAAAAYEFATAMLAEKRKREGEQA